MISGLRVGEALIVGEALNHPVLISIRGRKSKISGKGINFEDALKEYSNKTKRDDEDIKTFM